MYQVDNASAATALPAPAAVGPNPNGFFTGGSPGVTPATVVDADWMNAVMMEIINVIVAASITPSKTNRAQLLQAIQSLGRIRLTTNLNLYVATTGNDANSGLSAGTPFLTLQAAANAAANLYDTNGFAITVNVADGTYTAGVILQRALVGGGQLNFTGDITTPTACVVNVVNASCFVYSAGSGIVQGFLVEATGAIGSGQGCGIIASTSGSVNTNHMAYGTCQAHKYSAPGGNISATGATETIVGNAGQHLLADQGNINVTGSSLTIPAAEAFTTFAVAEIGGAIQYLTSTISGAGVAGCTGVRYAVTFNGILYTAAAGASFFPGSTAGSVSNGGVYN
jgi:hypothetical protein